MRKRKKRRNCVETAEKCNIFRISYRQISVVYRLKFEASNLYLVNFTPSYSDRRRSLCVAILGSTV